MAKVIWRSCCFPLVYQFTTFVIDTLLALLTSKGCCAIRELPSNFHIATFVP